MFGRGEARLGQEAGINPMIVAIWSLNPCGKAVPHVPDGDHEWVSCGHGFVGSVNRHLPRHGGGDQGSALLAEEVDAGLDVGDDGVGRGGNAEAFCGDGALLL